MPAAGHLRTLVNEIGSTDWQPSKITNQGYEYVWVLPVAGQNYTYTATRAGRGLWFLNFHDRRGSYDRTAIGHEGAVQVFSGLLAFVDAFLREKHPREIRFSGEGASRMVLYDRLARRLAAHTGAQLRMRDIKGDPDDPVGMPAARRYSLSLPAPRHEAVVNEFSSFNWYARARVTNTIDSYYWRVPIEGQVYHFEADMHQPGHWYVQFTDSKGRTSITGVGHKTAVQVISALWQYITTFLRKKRPQELVFTADEPSRQALYERMLRRLTRLIPGASWRAEDGDGYRAYYFTVSQKKQPVMQRESQSYATAVQQILHEMGNTPLRPRVISEPMYYAWQAEVADDIFTYSAEAKRELGPNAWYIQFKDGEGRYDLTGIGHRAAIQVMSGANQFIRAVLRAKRPDTLVFSAKGESRQALYDHMIRRLESQMPEMTWSYFDQGRTRLYELTFDPVASEAWSPEIGETLQQILNEIGDTQWHNATIRSTSHEYSWAVPIGGQVYTFEALAQDSKATHWGILFSDEAGNYHLTGVGHEVAVRVMSATMSFVQQVLRSKHPLLLEFSASEASRVSMYDRMIRSLLRHIPGSTVTISGSGEDKVYFVRIPQAFYTGRIRESWQGDAPTSAADVTVTRNSRGYCCQATQEGITYQFRARPWMNDHEIQLAIAAYDMISHKPQGIPLQLTESVLEIAGRMIQGMLALYQKADVVSMTVQEQAETQVQLYRQLAERLLTNTPTALVQEQHLADGVYFRVHLT